MPSVQTEVCSRWKGEDMYAKEAKNCVLVPGGRVKEVYVKKAEKCVPGGRANTERGGCPMCGQNTERRLPRV